MLQSSNENKIVCKEMKMRVTDFSSATLVSGRHPSNSFQRPEKKINLNIEFCTQFLIILQRNAELNKECLCENILSDNPKFFE